MPISVRWRFYFLLVIVHLRHEFGRLLTQCAVYRTCEGGDGGEEKWRAGVLRRRELLVRSVCPKPCYWLRLRGVAGRFHTLTVFVFVLLAFQTTCSHLAFGLSPCVVVLLFAILVVSNISRSLSVLHRTTR